MPGHVDECDSAGLHNILNLLIYFLQSNPCKRSAKENIISCEFCFGDTEIVVRIFSLPVRILFDNTHVGYVHVRGFCKHISGFAKTRAYPLLTLRTGDGKEHGWCAADAHDRLQRLKTCKLRLGENAGAFRSQEETYNVSKARERERQRGRESTSMCNAPDVGTNLILPCRF